MQEIDFTLSNEYGIVELGSAGWEIIREYPYVGFENCSQRRSVAVAKFTASQNRIDNWNRAIEWAKLNPCYPCPIVIKNDPYSKIMRGEIPNEGQSKDTAIGFYADTLQLADAMPR